MVSAFPTILSAQAQLVSVRGEIAAAEVEKRTPQSLYIVRSDNAAEIRELLDK
jgi:hypothetical protein